MYQKLIAANMKIKQKVLRGELLSKSIRSVELYISELDYLFDSPHRHNHLLNLHLNNHGCRRKIQ